MVPTIEKHQNFICFDGHGWVISFNGEVVNAQLRVLDKDDYPQIVIDLGCTGIESYLSSELDAYYVA